MEDITSKFDAVMDYTHVNENGTYAGRRYEHNIPTDVSYVLVLLRSKSVLIAGSMIHYQYTSKQGIPVSKVSVPSKKDRPFIEKLVKEYFVDKAILSPAEFNRLKKEYL